MQAKRPNPFAARAAHIAKKQAAAAAAVVAPPAPVPVPVPAPVVDTGLWTETRRPQSLARMVGNSSARTHLQQWATTWKPGGVAVISGPVGVGKTTAAHAVMRDAGRQVVDLSNAPSGDFARLLTDAVHTPPSPVFPAVGVVVDEVQLLGRAQQEVLVGVVRAGGLQAPVVVVCNDPYEVRGVVSAVTRAGGPHIKFFAPHARDVATLARQLEGPCPPGGMTDLRQVVIAAQFAPNSSRDVWTASPWTTAAAVVSAPLVDGVTTMTRNASIVVTWMTAHMPDATLEDAVARLEQLSVADVVDAHHAHETHLHATWLHVGAVRRSGRPGRAEFPSVALGWRATARTTAATCQRVLFAARQRTPHTVVNLEEVAVLRHSMTHSAALRKHIGAATSSEDVKRFNKIHQVLGRCG